MISSAVAAVEAALRAAGVEPELRTFPESVPTAAAAAAVLGCEVGAIANSLVFTQVPAVPAVPSAPSAEAGSGESPVPLLVLASGAHRVDTAGLAQRLGSGKIRRASPEFVLEHTGQLVGGVAPVGHPRPVPTVIDPDLAQFGVLWAGGGDKYTMFATSFDELVAMTGGTVIPVA